MENLTLVLKPSIEMTDDQFFELCQQNQDLQFERSSAGELIIMPPTGGETGNHNAGITAQLWVWNQKSKQGKVFDSSTGFKLPNKAERAPDAAWIKLEKWEALTNAQRQKFLPLCPDFVVEFMSPSDSLPSVQAKMQEYMDNGTQLGWLIDSAHKTVIIYRPQQLAQVLKRPKSLSGEHILEGFTLDLTEILN
jgi:Uma2 family endonuclease